MDIFTLPQLKTIVKHFDLKNIKMSAKKPQLIQQIEQYVHFDGYQFHLKDTNEDQYIKHELLKKQPRQTKKSKKEEMDEEGNFEPIEPKPKKKSKTTQTSVMDEEGNFEPIEPKKIKKKKKPVMDAEGNFEPIEPKPKKKKIKKTDYIPPQQPKKIKKKPVMDAEGNFEPIEPKPKKKKIKKIYNEEDEDIFKIPPLTTKKKNLNKPATKAKIEDFYNPEVEDWKNIYKNYQLELKKEVKDAKKLNKNFDAKDYYEIRSILNDDFKKKYGLHPQDFLHENRLKYDKKYLEKYNKEQEKAKEYEEYLKNAVIQNAIKNAPIK
jgi:hypothetical protein